MKQKLEQLNQSYKKALGSVLLKRFPGEGIIVEDVLLDPSLQHGRVWLHCSTTQLTAVQARRGELQSMVQDYLKTRYTPKIDFRISDNYLDKMENLFEELNKDEN